MSEREVSFTELCILESCTMVRKSQCCRRAFAFGLLIGAGKADGDDITLRLRTESLSDVALKLVKEQFGREAAVKHVSLKTDTY